MARVLAIDAGTTGVRAIVVAESGEVLARGYREFPQRFPRPGWVEHDPADWWEALLAACREAFDRSKTRPGSLAGIGITNQRETTVLWDRDTLEAVHPAIVWQDRRTSDVCRRLVDEGWEDHVRDRTGLLVDPYFSGTKLAWLLENVPEARKAAEVGRLAFGTVDAYLLARLTGGREHATDWTNASRTMLFDIDALDWDGELLDRLGIPTSVLPRVAPSGERFGVTDPNAFFGAAVSVSGMAGDQQAALFGQACFTPGATKNTYGTGCFVLMHTGRRPVAPSSGLITTIACGEAGAPAYALEGSIFVTGAAVQWLRDGLGLISRSAEAGPLAESVPDAGGVYFVPALTGLGAPWWDPLARGTIVGLTRGTTRAHLVRAAVEAMAFQTMDVVRAMTDHAGLALDELRVDGGAAAMDVLLQFQADLLGVPVRRAAVQESTALGAAYLAGLTEGVWAGLEDVGGRWREDRAFLPGDREAAAARYGGWRRAVERALGWAIPSETP